MSIPTAFERDLYAAGQPTPDDLERLAYDGVRTVINLRGPTEEVGFDEVAEARRLDLDYVLLPTTGAADINRARVAQFGKTLDAARAKGGVLIHCATSNRVGAMVALDAVFNRGQSLEAALARGRAAGLASLEPVVIDLAKRESTRG